MLQVPLPRPFLDVDLRPTEVNCIQRFIRKVVQANDDVLALEDGLKDSPISASGDPGHFGGEQVPQKVFIRFHGSSRILPASSRRLPATISLFQKLNKIGHLPLPPIAVGVKSPAVRFGMAGVE
jgi:hypothetical protein